MLFYDFEVFQYDWLVVIINPLEKSEKVIINDIEELRNFYELNSNEIWIGYNSKNYDQFILKGLLLGINPKLINDLIITENKKGWEISDEFRKIKFFNYDVMTRGDPSLKTLEGFMGNNIKESTVPFNLPRKLTDEEIKEVVEYCRHDVQQTMEVFLQRKNEFESHIELSKVADGEKLNLSHLNKTKTQLSSLILNAKRNSYDDEFDIQIPKNLKIKKYSDCVEWFKHQQSYVQNIIGKSGKSLTQKNEYKRIIGGIPHILGFGGIHGAIPKYHGVGKFVLMDVTSLYPTLMINYNLLSRSVPNPDNFLEVYNENLRLKAAGNKKKREPYKLTCNSTYGAMKDKYNSLYDPRQANNVCVFGQLFLIDLIEQLEPHCSIIQSNTDGILVKYNDFTKIKEITEEWMARTNLELEFDFFKEIYQKDVNNYVFIGEDSYKTKGAFVKSLNNLDYDLPIVNTAIVEYLVNKTPIEDTIWNCKSLKEFQMIRKITNKYEHIMIGNKILNERCVRIFASKSVHDNGIYQKSARTGSYEKIKDSPERCFIDNDDVNGKSIPKKLDHKFYIDLVKHRLELFGVKYV